MLHVQRSLLNIRLWIKLLIEELLSSCWGWCKLALRLLLLSLGCYCRVGEA